MKLAFSKATSSAEEADALFRRFRSVGYDGLQLKPNQYQPYLADPQRLLDRWGTYPGAVSALIGYGPLDGEDRERLRRTFAFGRAVGAERIVYCHSVPREGLTHDDLRTYARMLSELGREARGYGLRLSLRHHYNQPVMHRDESDVFFAGVEEGTVGLTVDTAHLVKSGVRDIARLIRDLRDVIDNFHLKDSAEGEFQLLGTGDIDFGPVFAAIRLTSAAACLLRTSGPATRPSFSRRLPRRSTWACGYARPSRLASPQDRGYPPLRELYAIGRLRAPGHGSRVDGRW